MRTCKQGHRLEVDTDYDKALLKLGKRRCGRCAAIYRREWKERKRRAEGRYVHGAKPFCRNGHPLVPGNLRVGKRPSCLTCHRERERKAAQPRLQRMGSVLLFDPCAYCGAKAEHLDHIQPLSAGGSSGWDHLTAACAACNQSKCARPLLTYLL